MRFSPTGELFFRRAATPAAESTADVADVVSRAWQAAERCLGQLAGDAALRLSGAVYNPSQRSYTVTLDYFVDGIPVRLASGSAGEIVVRDDTVIQARLQLREFTRTQARTKLLPCLQTAAIAERQQRQPELIYADGGEATECMWVMADG